MLGLGSGCWTGPGSGSWSRSGLGFWSGSGSESGVGIRIGDGYQSGSGLRNSVAINGHAYVMAWKPAMTWEFRQVRRGQGC